MKWKVVLQILYTLVKRRKNEKLNDFRYTNSKQRNPCASLIPASSQVAIF